MKEIGGGRGDAAHLCMPLFVREGAGGLTVICTTHQRFQIKREKRYWQ